MTLVDLTSDDLSWFEAQIAGAELKARMTMLHSDAERGVRTVLVAFPDGWRRDAIGTQPAGEEMICLTGALTVTGITATPGNFLTITPRALRSATSTEDGTRAVVWFTGEGGGWVDGKELVSGTATLSVLDEGFVRQPQEGLRGRVELQQDVSGRTFEVDVEVVWPDGQQYAYVPAGQSVPEASGRALVRFLD